MKHVLRALGAACLVVGASSAVGAQSGSNHFNVALGAAIPSGDFGNGADVGYQAAAGIDLTQRGAPFGLRFEGMLADMGLSNSSQSLRVIGGTANAVLQFSTTSTAEAGNTLYGIGGIGYYNTSATFLRSSQSNVGWNLGAGFRFPLTGFSAYVEARYHSISSTSVRFIPVSFGLVF